MAANEQLFRSFILGLRSNVVASYRSPLIIDWALSPDLHLDDCVKRGCIEEPRAKYLDSWASTFWDALRVNPARIVFRKSSKQNFTLIKTIEIFCGPTFTRSQMLTTSGGVSPKPCKSNRGISVSSTAY